MYNIIHFHKVFIWNVIKMDFYIPLIIFWTVKAFLQQIQKKIKIYKLLYFFLFYPGGWVKKTTKLKAFKIYNNSYPPIHMQILICLQFSFRRLHFSYIFAVLISLKTNYIFRNGVREQHSTAFEEALEKRYKICFFFIFFLFEVCEKNLEIGQFSKLGNGPVKASIFPTFKTSYLFNK